MTPHPSTDPLLRRDAADIPAGDPPSPDSRAEPGSPALRRFGMWLFLASLVVLFSASLVGYLIVRLTHEAAPPAGFFSVPLAFYFSTIALIASGIAVECAARAASSAARRRSLAVALAFSGLFIAMQVPPLAQLYAEHEQALAAAHAVGLYGLILTLIVVHALHVLGGLVPLAVLARNQFSADRPDPAPETLRAVALYWHFLDAVWLTMLVTFILTR